MLKNKQHSHTNTKKKFNFLLGQIEIKKNWKKSLTTTDFGIWFSIVWERDSNERMNGSKAQGEKGDNRHENGAKKSCKKSVQVWI